MPSPRGRSRRVGRALVAFTAILAVATLGLPAGTSFGQVANPEIELLNPSSFADTGGPQEIIVSSAQPTADSCPDPDHCVPGEFYHLVAWTAAAPSGSSVVFVATQGLNEFEINGTETVPGTWEAEWSIPTEVQEGPGTIQAFIAVGNAAVATDEQAVTFSHIQDNVQFGYPRSNQPFGTFAPLASALPAEGAPPARKAPRAGLDVNFTDSDQLSLIIAFYTTSDPGTEPEWKTCATEVNNGGGFRGGIRCILEGESEQLQITALAAVANDSPDPSGATDPAWNMSGDVARPSEVYVQQPGTVNALANGVQAVANAGSCSATTTVELLDTRGNEMLQANLDFHATKPDDRLKFNNIATPFLGPQGQAPNRDSSHSTEQAWNCTTASSRAEDARTQGEHNRFGAADIKHLELTSGGTNDQGQQSFRLRSPEQGTAFWSAWADEAPDSFLTDNDAWDSGEPCLNGSVGWGTETPPAPSPSEPLSCTTAPEPTPTTTSSPSPSPSGSPTAEPSGDRSITLERNKARIRKGRRVRFTGEITAREIPACEVGERVKLKAKRPGTRRFRTVALAQTDNEGFYRIVLRPKRTKIYRAVAPFNDPCKRARSNSVRVRVRNAS